MNKTSSMTVSSRSTCRAGFKCHCCQTAPGIGRVKERRTIKRSEKQKFQRELRND